MKTISQFFLSLALLLVLVVLMTTTPSTAAEIRFGPAASAAFLSVDGQTVDVGAIGAAVEVQAAIDSSGKQWVGFLGSHDGERLGGLGARWYLGLGQPEASGDGEFLAWPLYLGIGAEATFLDPASGWVDELTATVGPEILVELPIVGTDTFVATFGASYQFRMFGDGRVESYVPVTIDIPATF